MRDTLLEARCLESYAALAVSKDTLDPALAIDLLSRAADELGFPLSSSDKGILAYAYSVAGKASESQRWLQEARSTAETEAEMADVNFREYQIASRGGDSKKALASLDPIWFSLFAMPMMLIPCKNQSKMFLTTSAATGSTIR